MAGEPLTGLAGPWAARARESRTQEYIAALVAWAHCELGAGNHAVVVRRLPDLVAEHSLVEPFAAALMKALHAGGRGSDALACFTAPRERLAEELGADPGTEAKRLHQAILRSEDTAPGGPDHGEGSGPGAWPRRHGFSPSPSRSSDRRAALARRGAGCESPTRLVSYRCARPCRSRGGTRGPT
ncbi:BTAD domain-containing putative transcriptional regulator [Streptomyces sp. STR69]|uniref:AfsR/SARP family transcriptional regulator n=1 Tax=Streptomyces sp. STR69 TaxID=1796942 RepID=UPI003966DA29